MFNMTKMNRVNKVDEATIFSNSSMQSGLMANATAEALKNASSNENGAMMGFMGMNMASQAGSNVMGAVQGNGESVQGFANNGTGPEPGSLFKKEEKNEPEEDDREEVVEEPVEETEKIEEELTENTEKKDTKFCPKCGTEVSSDANFCTKCGQKLN